MQCCWKELMDLLPPWLRTITDREGRDKPIGEIRLRLGRVPQFTGWGREWRLTDRVVAGADLHFVVNAASQYSPYAARSIAQGFLTASGGHRVGLSGEWVIRDGTLQGMKHIRSVCIRVARDIDGAATGLMGKLSGDSVLILGKPGTGKTTLLRDLIRQISGRRKEQIAVIDQRQELFPTHYAGYCFDPGDRTDILTEVDKLPGIEMAVRTLSPDWVAVDEITSTEDCRTMRQCSWSGVRFLATLHAEKLADLENKPLYRSILSTGIFGQAVLLKGCNEYTVEELRNK